MVLLSVVKMVSSYAGRRSVVSASLRPNDVLYDSKDVIRPSLFSPGRGRTVKIMF